MKKTFESGKIWTILSALLFFMTCGVFIVHAAGSGNNGLFTQKYNTGALNNTLTATGWNQLMEDLDNLIPDGAVMAFATGTCPDGWSDYEYANGRFIVGIGNATMSDGTTHGYVNVVGKVGGDYRTSLEVNNLPSHSHNIPIGRRGADSANDNEQAISIGGSKPGGMAVNKRTTGKTNDAGNGSPFIAQIPFVGLKYCVKNYTPPKDTCPEGYSSNITSCGEGYKLSQKPSTFGSMSCGKCSPSCEGKFPYTELCSLEKGELYGGGVGVVSVGFDGGSFTCVRPGCCGSKKADFTESFPSLQGEKDRETELSNFCM